MKFTGKLALAAKPASPKKNTGISTDYSNKRKYDAVKRKNMHLALRMNYWIRNEILIFCHNFPFYIKNVMGTLCSTIVAQLAKVIVVKNHLDVSWSVNQDVNAQEV